MKKTFIVKNLRGKDIGKIIFSDNKFQVDIADKKNQEKIQVLLNSFIEKGIYDLGEVILKNPIKLSDFLFFDEIQNQLARRGYTLMEIK